jgi:8-oxo-dGTP diphosphatase
MQHVVIAIILNAEKQVLIAERMPHQVKAGYWEFPGGKVNAGETAFQALQREIFEELGVQITLAEPWLQFDFQYPHGHVLLDTWLVKSFTGEPCGAEGQPIQWVSLSDLSRFQFPEGNQLIIERLGCLE